MTDLNQSYPAWPAAGDANGTETGPEIDAEPIEAATVGEGDTDAATVDEGDTEAPFVDAFGPPSDDDDDEGTPRTEDYEAWAAEYEADEQDNDPEADSAWADLL